MFKNQFYVILILLLIFITLGVVSASDNLTDAMDDGLSSQSVSEIPIDNEIKSNASEPSQIAEDTHVKINTEIESRDITTYYKEKSELVTYLKDNNNQPLSAKKISITVNSKVYSKITDNEGRAVLKLNLNPGNYVAKIKFAGDENYSASSAHTLIKVNKASLKITTKNYKTYFESGFYFKAKIINQVTKNPVNGVKIAFKVIKNNKYKTYWATTDDNGIAILKKNLKVGSYNVVTSIKKNKYLKAKKTKSMLTIKETAEIGCTTYYLQVNNAESVTGFRRDGTNAKTMIIVKYKLNGKLAVKQYKNNDYFFHTLTTADGWMAGTGGIDNPSINHAIEKLVGKMSKSGKIKKSYLKKIQGYEKRLGIGHFSIKSPDGKYALVWASSIQTGKLKPGQYICVPNGKSYFRLGSWEKFSKDPAKAAIKVVATDKYGVNRRDATAFHWKSTTYEGRTTSTVKVYAANDNGKLIGRSTGYLKDNVRFMGKFVSKNSLPKTPNSKFLGTVKLGNIDKLIKTQTVVKSPSLSKKFNESKTFDITVKNKKTNKAIKNLKLNVKIDKKTYSIKTDSHGIAHFNPESLNVGKYEVIIYSANDKYFVSAKSTIIIK